jgi:hypothetical protein
VYANAYMAPRDIRACCRVSDAPAAVPLLRSARGRVAVPLSARRIQCMEDPRLLLERYNEAAIDYNRTHPDTLARWSPVLLRAIRSQT